MTGNEVKVICPAHPCQAPGPLWAGGGEGKRHSGVSPPPVASPLEKGPPPHQKSCLTGQHQSFHGKEGGV